MKITITVGVRVRVNDRFMVRFELGLAIPVCLTCGAVGDISCFVT